MIRKAVQARGVVCLELIALGLPLFALHRGAVTHAAEGQTSSLTGSEAPAYHAKAPQGRLPATLDPGQFPDAVNQNTYGMAAKIKKVLYQEPCYCYCDRGEGHGSLLDCFVGTHASICEFCKKEAVYTYNQTRKGKSAVQIRNGITRGEWKTVDLTRYGSPGRFR